ncbi:MAG: pitrilysin family protein [Bacteroidota bacterium]|nr:pitrilysin family protein [Bacteroidota bacterium]
MIFTKFNKHIAALSVALIIGTLCMAQATLVEEVKAQPGKTVIPYKKYKLKNGLTIIVHEDHSDPMVHVDVTYHVGSAREEIGKSGFAHFFEHMMFQGSEHVGDEMHFKYISEAGGNLNGTTNRDRTNYFETLPKDYLEMALWLESDRMGFLLDSVTKQKFEVQRSTVKNERGQRYDNVPYGLVGEFSAKNFYPYGHPYSWLTIGYVEELNAVDENDLKRFFMRWYGPNNATLTVGGDVSTDQVIKLAEKYFGTINQCPTVGKAPIDVPQLAADRHVNMEDNIRFPQLSIIYPGIPMGHPDEAALDVLCHILSNGRGSFMYRNFIKPQKAMTANVGSYTYELSGEITFTVRTMPGASLVSMDSLLNATLNEFDIYKPNNDDLNRAVNEYENSILKSLGSVSSKVSRLASYQTFLGNPNMIGEELSAYHKVTANDVKRVFNQYIKGKHKLVVSTVPKGKKELSAAPDDYIVDSAGYIKPKDQYSGIKYLKAKDIFDRNKKPNSSAGLNPPHDINYWQTTIPNNIPVYGITNTELPFVNFRVAMKGGHLLDGYDTSKNGLANITAAMLNESTLKHSAEELSNMIEVTGSSISFNASGEYITLDIECQKKYLPEVTRIAIEKIMEPKFDLADFSRVKNRLMESIANQSTQATTMASQLFAKLVYGPNNINALPADGTVASLKNITIDDVKDFYKKYLNSSNMYITVVGDIEQPNALQALAFVRMLPSTNYDMPATPKEYQTQKTKLYLIDKPGAAQSEIRVGYLALPYDAYGVYYKCTVMNYVLGGAFNSRINLNLREKNGWTYGARSSFSGGSTAGPFSVSAGVKKNATDSAILEIIKELEHYKQQGITIEEMNFTKNALMNAEDLKYETNGAKLGYLNTVATYNLTPQFMMQKFQTLQQLSESAITRLAGEYLPVDQMYIVVVGDKKTILPGLEKLGYEIVE